MVESHPIICPECGKQVTTEENIRYLYLEYDIRCPNCDSIVIKTNNILY